MPQNPLFEISALFTIFVRILAWSNMSNIVDNNEELIDKNENTDDFQGDETPLHNSTYKVPSLNDESNKHHLSGMYQTWFLDYASYVNL